MKKPIALIASLVAAGTAFAADSVVDAIARNPSLSMTSQFIQQAGLADTLRGGGPYVVFAPTNDAYKAMPQAQLDEISGNKEALKAMLGFHVVAGQASVAGMHYGAQKTVNGQPVSVYRSGNFFTVENAVVTQADVPASNGAVEVIDTVLVPAR